MQENNNNVWIAGSIVIAGLLIAGAVYFTRDSGSSSEDFTLRYTQFMNKVNARFSSIRPTSENEDINILRAPSEKDYIRGSLDAPIIIVEYSDSECPFCGMLHKNLTEVVAMYEGKVAWVYRHLPLVSLHKKAIIEAHAMECAGELGGNEKFWEYADSVYSMTNGNDALDLNQLPVIAKNIGLNVKDFNKCMDSERHVAKIEADYAEVLNATAGMVGTPFNVIFTKDGSRIVASGALPVPNWINIIDNLLSAGQVE
ncbi:MAG TPA: thioredoxin domain-containing protein [Candidatus Paceibacterota bacterium]|mgnify:FL=1|nr:thioredoxin domain-containing protein [Candidatus Paceibacterota bacterium]